MYSQSLDLFGDVVIKHSDITLWLKHLGLHNSAKSRREYYAEHWDIANKIKLSMLNGSFAKLITQYEDDDNQADAPLDFFSTQYKSPEQAAPACTSEWHRCTVKSCPVYKKLLRRDRNLRYLANKKAAALKAEQSAARAAKKAAKLAALVAQGVKF